MPVARVVHPGPWMLTSHAVKLGPEGDGSGYPTNAKAEAPCFSPPIWRPANRWIESPGTHTQEEL
jgi:hypothetical protein